jgi:Tfp pilus assembly protein PilZ
MEVAMRRITSALHASSRGLGKLRQRNAVRAFVHLPAWLTIDRDDTSEHVAFVRDISARGIFFYSDVEAAAGNQLTFVLEYLHSENRVRLHLKGRVVRVEQPTPNSAIGIAVAFPSRIMGAALLRN